MARVKVFIVAAVIVLSNCCLAKYDPNHFDPDNAAHWYRKAFEFLEPFDFDATSKYFASKQRVIEPDSDTRKIEQQLEDSRQLREYIHGQGERTDNIEQQINEEVVDLFMKASKCRVCDWGYGDLENPSQEKVLQHISEQRMLSDGLQIVLASSVMAAEKGLSDKALEQWAATFTINQHYFDSSLPYGLWDRDIIRCAQHLLGLLADNPMALEKVGNTLDNFIRHRPTIAEKFDQTTEEYVKIIVADQISNNRHTQTAKGGAIKGDFDINRYRDYRKELRKVWLLPYAKSIPEIKRIRKRYLFEQLEQSETPVDINVYLISLYDRHILTDRHAGTYYHTSDNAVYIASQVYLYHAKHGKLPSKMLPNMPKDPYSEKPFMFIKTKTGFKLKCRGKMLHNNKYHQFEFVLPEEK